MRIRAGKLIPILSDSICKELLFTEEIKPGTDVEVRPVLEGLAEAWAEQIGYPEADRRDLARVALYNTVISRDAEQAKTAYLSFLKTRLIDQARRDSERKTFAEEVERQVDELSFSKLANELDYACETSRGVNPLSILAKLPLPIYITTSPHDFLERALQLAGKQPQTKLCFWSGEELGAEEAHLPDPLLKPTPAEPLVYHLFGLENYPLTLLVSEDDYLDFLDRVVSDTDTQNPLIPLILKRTLAQASLVVLGYHLRDWDFRVLFRSLIKPRSQNQYSLVLQLEPEKDTLIDPSSTRDYLDRYFQRGNLSVEWGRTVDYLQAIGSRWRIAQGGAEGTQGQS
jgi:hypothetical protein